MKNTLYLFFTITCLFLSIDLNGQQMAQSSFVEDAKHYWNPAATGLDHNIHTNLFFRQQWLSFGGAPRTGFISGQYPLIDHNMAVGAIINFDQTGPVSKKGLKLNYAYKLRELIGEDSQLSLGLTAGIQQYAFNPNGETFNDFGDVLLQGTNSSSWYPTIGAGVYFLSSTQTYKENTFFAGVAFRDAWTTDVLINNSNQERQRHLHLNIGTRVYQRHSFIEPSVTLNMTAPDLIDLRAGVRYEMEDSFWAGIGYSTVNDASIQGGIILPEFGDRFGNLKVGALANFAITNHLSQLGPGFEFFIGYDYDID